MMRVYVYVCVYVCVCVTRLQSWPRVIGSACLGLTDWVSLRVAHLARAQATSPATGSTVQGPICGPVWYQPLHCQACPDLHMGPPVCVCVFCRWGSGSANSSKQPPAIVLTRPIVQRVVMYSSKTFQTDYVRKTWRCKKTRLLKSSTAILIKFNNTCPKWELATVAARSKKMLRYKILCTCLNAKSFLTVYLEWKKVKK